MASGSIYGTTSNQYIRCRLDYNSTVNVEANTSDITVNLYYWRDNSGYTTWGELDSVITLNGTSKSAAASVSMSGAGESTASLAATQTFTVAHNADGTKSVPVSVSGGISGTSFSSTSLSGTITLDTIPRASTMTISGNTIGGDVTFDISAASSSFTHSLTYQFGNSYSTILSYAAAGSHGWTIPMSLANQIPSATSGVITFVLYTWSAGGSSIGTRTYTVTIGLPSSVVPSISGVSISEATAGISAKFGGYVQLKSTLSVKVTAAGIYGSTISSYKTVVEAKTYTDASFTTDAITGSGTVSVVTTVTDTRGRTAQVTNTITVLAYSPPKITSFVAKRIDTTGTESDEGERLEITMAYAVASVNGKNDRNYALKYKKASESSYTSIDSGTAEVSYSGTVKYTTAPAVSTDYTYTIELELADYFTSITYDAEIPTGATLVDYLADGKGMAIGKVAEQTETLEIAWDVKIGKSGESKTIELNGKTIFDMIYPVGSIYLSTVYFNPGTVFGGTWVSIKDRFLLASGDTYGAGATGGESSHVLTNAETPLQDTIPYVNPSGSGDYSGISNSIAYVTGRSREGFMTYTKQSGGSAHNNMPPYLVVYMWRRTA